MLCALDFAVRRSQKGNSKQQKAAGITKRIARIRFPKGKKRKVPQKADRAEKQSGFPRLAAISNPAYRGNECSGPQHPVECLAKIGGHIGMGAVHAGKVVVVQSGYGALGQLGGRTKHCFGIKRRGGQIL